MSHCWRGLERRSRSAHPAVVPLRLTLSAPAQCCPAPAALWPQAHLLRFRPTRQQHIRRRGRACFMVASRERWLTSLWTFKVGHRDIEFATSRLQHLIQHVTHIQHELYTRTISIQLVHERDQRSYSHYWWNSTQTPPRPNVSHLGQ